MTLKPSGREKETVVLIEGPAWGDAGFYGQWLLDAAKANELLQQAKKDDQKFREAIATLEILHCLDFGIGATLFLSWLNRKFHSFVIDSSSEDLMDFVLM